MISSVSAGFALLSVLFFISCYDKTESSDVKISRVRRDTSEWVRRSINSPLLQDFGNGTTNNATSNIWKKCECAFNACDCSAEFEDFNASKLYIRVEHIKSHPRFKVKFHNENRTINQEFILTNGTSCFQFRRRNFDQICFLRYGSEQNAMLEKACFAVGVRIQQYSVVSTDYECIKHMNDGTTHVGLLNLTSPDLNYLANYTLYGSASNSRLSLLALLASVLTAIFISKINI